MLPAECFHVGEFLRDEMDARGLIVEDVALAMGPESEYEVNYLTLEFILHLRDARAIISRETFGQIAKALGQDDSAVETWVRLDAGWKRWMTTRNN